MSSRDVSPDSSTQPKQEHRKSKKRKQKHRSHKPKKKKVEKTPDPESVETESADSGSSKNKKKTKKRKQQSPPAIDPTLEITIKPLAAYVDDRDELFKQLLSTVSKKDLKNMLPNILKKESLKEVKRLCLEHLKALSTKKLQNIISGQEMSPSGDEEEPQQADGNKQTAINTTTAHVDEEQCPPVTPAAEEEKDAEIFEELITAPNQEEIDELVEGSPAEAELKQVGVVDHNQDNAQTSLKNDVMSGTADEMSTPKEELELKELEFRARALKSLVQARERQMKLAVNSPFVGSS